jgi:hypothetical protein
VVQIGSLYVAKNTNTLGTYNGGTMNWNAAIPWADNLVWLEKDDWRIPKGYTGSPDEFYAICGQKTLLGNYATGMHWTSTTHAPNPTYAKAISFPTCANTLLGDKASDYYYVRVVRP